MRFWKLHGTGNDFILVDARHMERDWPTLARLLCERHYGVGGDGLILALPSEGADLRMRIFNADGSEAEMCGNGIRCFAKFALEGGLLSREKGTLTVETLAGVKTLVPTYQDGRAVRVRAGMGQPGLRPQDIPFLPQDMDRGVFDITNIVDYPLSLAHQDLPITVVSMGNPHAVHFTEREVTDFPLAQVGPQVEHHAAFPNRTNFGVAHLVASGDLRLRVWERGVGETLACGTGACAAVVAARLHGWVNDVVDVTLPGGQLTIRWDGQGEVYLEGPVEAVFQGEWLGE